jgi:hypothetical protein
VPQDPHRHGREAYQQARRARRLDAHSESEDQRGDDELTACYPEQTAHQPDAEVHRGDQTHERPGGQEAGHVLGQEGLHDERRADHHQEDEDHALQQVL